MSMISFASFFLIAIVILAIYTEEKYIKSQAKAIWAQNLTLLLASYLFIAYADVRFALILAIQSVLVWYCSQKASRIKLGILFMVLILAVLKYLNFFYNSFSALLGAHNTIALHLIIPLGISFYTFSAISYLTDIRRGKESPHDLLHVALYLSFFPKLTSGPIQRSHDFFPQLMHERAITGSSL